MPIGKPGRTLAGALVLGSLCGGPAFGDSKPPNKVDCIAADTDGQSLRLEGKLHAARKRFTICTSASCPEIVREDCVERVAEIEKAQPTVIFSATNGNGRPVMEVKVFVDETPIAERLDGQAFAIDPGEHVFTFKALGRTDAEMRLSIREGERERHGVVLRTVTADPLAATPLRTAQSSAVPTAPALSPEPHESFPSSPLAGQPAISLPSSDASSTSRGVAVAIGGAGVVGLGISAIFGLLTISNWSAAQRDCGAACPANSVGQGEASAASADGTISTVAFIGGAAALGAGVALWFLAPESSSPQTSMRVVPSVGLRRGEIVVESRF